jgi:hypothetical protein
MDFTGQEAGLVLACILLPFANMLFRWCGKKIRAATSRLPDGKLKRLLLIDLHARAK